jgi:transposase InsO family protein
VNKDWKGGSNTPGERLYVDISSIKGKSFRGAKFWALIVDDFSGYCWSYFLKRKDELSNSVVSLIQELRNDNIFVRTLRLDDAGENYALKKACKHEKLCIKLAYSGPRTPQRIGKVERKFQTLYGKIRAMLNDAGVDKDFRERLWAECASSAAYYENLIVDKESNKDPNNLLFNQLLNKESTKDPYGLMFN